MTNTVTFLDSFSAFRCLNQWLHDSLCDISFIRHLNFSCVIKSRTSALSNCCISHIFLILFQYLMQKFSPRTATVWVVFVSLNELPKRLSSRLQIITETADLCITIISHCDLLKKKSLAVIVVLLDVKEKLFLIWKWDVKPRLNKKRTILNRIHLTLTYLIYSKFSELLLSDCVN